MERRKFLGILTLIPFLGKAISEKELIKEEEFKHPLDMGVVCFGIEGMPPKCMDLSVSEEERKAYYQKWLMLQARSSSKPFTIMNEVIHQNLSK